MARTAWRARRAPCSEDRAHSPLSLARTDRGEGAILEGDGRGLRSRKALTLRTGSRFMTRPALVLGGTGMIGPTVVVTSFLERGLDVRARTPIQNWFRSTKRRCSKNFASCKMGPREIAPATGRDFVINCGGPDQAVHPRRDPATDAADAVNGDFHPSRSWSSPRVSLSTYDGLSPSRAEGRYLEDTRRHDATDVLRQS